MTLWPYLAGIGVAVAFSAAAAPTLIRRTGGWPRHKEKPRLHPTLVRFVCHPIGLGVIATVSVILFGLTVAVGFLGAQNSYRNMAPTVVWAVVWVGTATVSATIGNLWALINPWAILFSWTEALYGRWRPGRRLSRGLRYPDRFGAWPAVVLFAALVWTGLIWEAGQTPARMALVITVYSVFTWTGMLVFGKDTWLRKGEALSVAFALLARLAILQQREGDSGAGQALYLRPPGAGLLADRPLSWPLTAMVLLMLATVFFDGLVETPVWNGVHDWILDDRAVWPFIATMRDFGLSLPAAIKTTAFILLTAGIFAVYLLLCWIAAWAGGATAGKVARTLVMLLLPVAAAFHLAHHLPAIAGAGRQIVNLAADPFGLGWSLWEVADRSRDAAGTNGQLAWYATVAILVVGNILATVIGSAAVSRLFAGTRSTLVHQLLLAVLLAGSAMASLWILAQPLIGPGVTG